MYANVYCYLCNNPTLTNATICSIEGLSKLPLSMIYLFDVRALTEIQVVEGRKPTRCANNEIFDSYFVSVYYYLNCFYTYICTMTSVNTATLVKETLLRYSIFVIIRKNKHDRKHESLTRERITGNNNLTCVSYQGTHYQ